MCLARWKKFVKRLSKQKEPLKPAKTGAKRHIWSFWGIVNGMREVLGKFENNGQRVWQGCRRASIKFFFGP